MQKFNDPRFLEKNFDHYSICSPEKNVREICIVKDGPYNGFENFSPPSKVFHLVQRASILFFLIMFCEVFKLSIKTFTHWHGIHRGRGFYQLK